MTENVLLEQANELLSNEGAEAAYDYLFESERYVLEKNRATIYKAEYRLAAMCGRFDEAVMLLCEAILDNGYTYELDTFSDPVFDELREHKTFKKCVEICRERLAAKPA